MIKNTQPKNHKKAIIIALLGLGVLLLVVTLFLVNKQDNASPATSTTPADVAPNTVKNEPATAEEKAEAENHKDDLVKQMNDEAAGPESGTRSVTPVITAINQNGTEITVNAYVGNVFEDGGTCSLTATKNGNTVSKTSQAFANATTTDCAPLRLERASFNEAGEWNFIIKYTSSSSQGSSATKVFTVK